MKQQLQYQQSIQHMLNVAKTQPTIVKTIHSTTPQPEPVIEETPAVDKSVIESVVEPIVEEPKPQISKTTRLPNINK